MDNSILAKFLIVLPPEVKIPSENFIYKPCRKGRKVFLYKDSRVRKFQETVTKSIDKSVLDTVERLIDKDWWVISFYQFLLPESRMSKSDVTNMVKATEDAIFSSLPLDDSRVAFSIVAKALTDGREAIKAAFMFTEEFPTLTQLEQFTKVAEVLLDD